MRALVDTQPIEAPTDVDVRVEALEVAQHEVVERLLSVERTLGAATFEIREQTAVNRQMLEVMTQILGAITTRREGPWARARRCLASWGQVSRERWYFAVARVWRRHG